MKLADYLATNRIKRIDFAALVGITPGWITSLCDETGWPSRDVAERIAKASEGAVTPNDFLKVETQHDDPAPLAPEPTKHAVNS